MSNCIICDFPAKPSHAQDWPVPYKVCCDTCMRHYEDELESIHEPKYMIQLTLAFDYDLEDDTPHKPF